ncbi:hypothetical protein YPPY01_0691, partial [Yersinia pestis PY-01]
MINAPPAAFQAISATVDGGFRPESAVTALIALPLVGIGKDAQTAAPHTDANATATAAVATVGFLPIGR